MVCKTIHAKCFVYEGESVSSIKFVLRGFPMLPLARLRDWASCFGLGIVKFGGNIGA